MPTKSIKEKKIKIYDEYVKWRLKVTGSWFMDRTVKFHVIC